MGERAYDRLARKYEAQDRGRIAAAFELIEREADLRFFLFTVLDACGMAADPFTGDPLTTAHACGKMAVGQDLLALAAEHAPALYATLLQEMMNEQRNRSDELHDRLRDD